MRGRRGEREDGERNSVLVNITYFANIIATSQSC